MVRAIWTFTCEMVNPIGNQRQTHAKYSIRIEILTALSEDVRHESLETWRRNHEIRNYLNTME